jgi:hypothetical protein
VISQIVQLHRSNAASGSGMSQWLRESFKRQLGTELADDYKSPRYSVKPGLSIRTKNRHSRAKGLAGKLQSSCSQSGNPVNYKSRVADQYQGWVVTGNSRKRSIRQQEHNWRLLSTE